jgi:hypothetical protein
MSDIIPEATIIESDVETVEIEAPKVDPAGVTPGLSERATPKETVVYLKCRNPKCDSMEATEIGLETPPQVGQRAYRCVKCGHTWSLKVGGALYL